MTRNQWLRAVRSVAREYEYRLDGITSNNHLRLVHRNARTQLTSQTPSDHRAIKNLRSQLRRALIAGVA